MSVARVLVVGIGARRGVSADEVRAALAQLEPALAGPADRPRERVYASVEAKADEAGILAAVAPGVLHTRSAAELARVEVVGNPLVQAATGTPSVAEAAALLVAREHDPGARLVVPKTVVGSVTVAAALAVIRDTPAG